MEVIRILLVDDDAVLREVTSAVLETDSGLKVVGEAESGQQAIERVEALSPDVVLLDMRMPGMSGIEALRLIRKKAAEVRIIALSGFSAAYMQTQCTEAGADAYLHKTDEVEQMFETIYRVMKAPPARSAESTDLIGELREVVTRFASGYPLQSIAAELGLDVATVVQRKDEGMQRLHVSSRAELARVTLAAGWK